jgi:hypothetical protein
MRKEARARVFASARAADLPVIRDKMGHGSNGLDGESSSMRDGLDRIAGTEQIDGIAIEVWVLLDESANWKRIIVLKGGRFGEALVDKITQGDEVTGGQGWCLLCFPFPHGRAAIISDSGHGGKCSVPGKRMVGKGSDFRSVKSISAREPQS